MGSRSPKSARSLAARSLVLFGTCAALGCASTTLEVRDDDPANPRSNVPAIPAAPATLQSGFDPKDEALLAGAADSSAGGEHSMHAHHHHHMHGQTPSDAGIAPQGSSLDGGAQGGGHR